MSVRVRCPAVNRVSSRLVCVAVAVTSVVLIAFVFAPSPGHARKPSPVQVISSVGDIEINWTRGLIIASRGASADLRAPTAGIASVKAERTAREKAVADAANAAAGLPWVGAEVSALSDEQVAETVAAEAMVLARQRTSDGSAIVTVGVPIEAVRRARSKSSLTTATPKSAPGKQKTPTALVVTVDKGLLTKRSTKQGVSEFPALGWTVSAGGSSHHGPVLFARTAAKKSLKVLGERPLMVAATDVGKGVISVAPSQKEAVEAAIAASSVVVVLINR